MFNIVLVEPEIPSNTGNIARTCAITGCSLHLIEPLGFSIDDKHLKRAGLDYWHLLNVHIYKDLAEFFEKNKPNSVFLATTKGSKCYSKYNYPPNAYLFFGKETKGLPEQLRREYPNHCFRIPMINDTRSLNLSNSVAITIYEALRQNGFPNMG